MIVPKRVGFLIFPGVQALDVAGPMDAFSAAVINGQPDRPQPCYKTFTVGLSTRTITAGCGLRLKTHFDIAHTPAMDTLIIPGGSGARDPHMGAPSCLQSRDYYRYRPDGWC